ncbi:MAG: hypothetical protein KF718_05530 [Polyangiaceae bacterium]|nr:hypothetical protein [Polyangiaceae bacterium]
MKSVLASLLAVVLGLSGDPAAPAPAPETPAVDEVVALAEVPAREASAETAAAPVLPAGPALPYRKVLRPHRLVLVPGDCATAAGPLDVMIHFHGAPEHVEAALARSGLRVALAIVNLGAGSGRYESAFTQDGSLARWLTGMETLLKQECGGRARGRVALSSWSAGYGAIYRILANEQDAKLVDAVLLADGLHAGYEPGSSTRVNALQMAPFTRFAERAARGDAIMALTHTNIRPPRYASSAATADHLLAATGTARTVEQSAGPRTMRLESRADAEGLHVRGFAGTGPDEHCDHLYALDALTWQFLGADWR